MIALERCAEGDEFLNYCLWPYAPLAPVAGKFSTAVPLFHTFQLAGLNDRAAELVARIRGAIGAHRTVWGVKLLGDGQLAWEFYFYDYRRCERERSASRVLEAIRPLVRCDVPINEGLPYFMFSLEVTGALLRGETELELVNLYLGNVGSAVSSGVSYAQTRHGRRLENFYFFFRPAEHLDEIIGKVRCSAHIDPPDLDLAEIIWPELIECDTVCFANKQHHDCIYFSGIGLEQLLFFFQRLRYPEPLVAWVQEHAHLLDHLRWDVGYDFTRGPEGLRVIKSGYYGTF